MTGLPGGSSGEGPASLVGLLVVVVFAAGIVAGIAWLLFEAVPLGP